MSSSSERGFTLIECLLVILIIGLLGFSVWNIFIKQRQPNINQNILLLDLNSTGSTNADAWTFSLYTNGGGVLTYQKPSHGTTGSNKTYKIETFNSSAIAYNLNQINFEKTMTCSPGKTDNLDIDTGSASFQQAVTLSYNGNKLSNFCTDNKAEFSLYKQLQAIEGTIKA